MAIQEMYLIESSRFEMNFNNEKTGTSPLEKHLKFLKDIPPIMNSWNHCNLESEEIIQKGHVEDYYNEAVLSKSKNTDADILMKYLSTKVLEMDDDWVFLNKILTFLKTLDNVDKCVFRKLVYKCMQTVEKSTGKEKEKCDEGSEPISNPMKNEKSDEPVEKVN
ncbi:PREDICTED: uncharacterized protein LOC107067389 [Polistes dominula]|uniref:Uncharacterized protein LOC107067389 n=1 Tax=Polistes dominula TaxID=743375 RepID=A0ABM1IDP0_POLDO|nr:PREDICTED: uncharacterized protein LOC107067389 [Polistes dominula]